MNIAHINTLLAVEGVSSAGKLHWFESIGSTNDFLLNPSPSGEFHAVVCMAGEQTQGRGRRGRHWVSSPGQGLYLSIGWSLQGANPGGLSLVCGLSVVNALSRLGVNGLALKWPNDVLLDYGKLGGILVEISGERCVIGIGLNVKLPVESATDTGAGVPGGALPATGLDEHGFHIDAELLAAKLITQLNHDLDRFCREGFSPFIDCWNAVHAYQGERVELLGASKVIGRVSGIDAQGALCLETDQGRQCFHAGEVSLRGSGSFDHGV